MAKRKRTDLERAATEVLRASTKFSRLPARRSMPSQGVAAINNRQRVVLRYSDSRIIPSNAVNGTYALNMNSLFDPDRTGAGTQPNGFDQWAAFYNRYCVYKCKVEWRYHCRDNTGVLFATLPSNEDTNVTAPTMAGLSYSTFDISLPGAGDVIKGSTTVDLPKFTGRTLKEYLSDDRFQALMSASPSEGLVFRFRIDTPDAAVVTGDLFYRMTFWAQLSDHTQLAQS